MVVVSFFFLDVAYKNLLQTLNLQKIKLNNISGLANRVRILPMLVLNTVVSLLSESKYFAISFYNKKIGFDCEDKKLEILIKENKCHRENILFLLISVLLLSLINVYFITR
ncbi:MAG TPA: hypothetical protein EYP82_02355 [Hydrogenothermaceae bacterium]|nr:hypothetical protein [Hydrogenothermaceae bacterium]